LEVPKLLESSQNVRSAASTAAQPIPKPCEIPKPLESSQNVRSAASTAAQPIPKPCEVPKPLEPSQNVRSAASTAAQLIPKPREVPKPLESSQTLVVSTAANSTQGGMPYPASSSSAVSASSVLCRQIDTPTVKLVPLVDGNPTSTQTSIDDYADDVREALLYKKAISLRRNEAQVGLYTATQFAAWFYDRLNKLDNFAAHHFWGECNLRILIESSLLPTDLPKVRQSLYNGAKSFELLRDFKTEYNLFFNPNLFPSIGVRGKMNPHGLVQVIVGGTLHRENGSGDIIAVFDQDFGIIRDPGEENNFKVKYSILNVRERPPPSVIDESLCGVIDEIDDDSESESEF
jgi:hypothetical protein